MDAPSKCRDYWRSDHAPLIQHAADNESGDCNFVLAVVAPHVLPDVLDEILIACVGLQDYGIRSNQAVPQENIDSLPQSIDTVVIGSHKPHSIRSALATTPQQGCGGHWSLAVLALTVPSVAGSRKSVLL